MRRNFLTAGGHLGFWEKWKKITGLFLGSSSMSMPNFVWIRWTGSKLLQKSIVKMHCCKIHAPPQISAFPSSAPAATAAALCDKADCKALWWELKISILSVRIVVSNFIKTSRTQNYANSITPCKFVMPFQNNQYIPFWLNLIQLPN